MLLWQEKDIMDPGPRSLILVAFLSGPSVAADLCVSNGTGARLHFTVEAAATGTRRAADLSPGETLCLKGASGGTVAAFESAASIEGCSRLVPAGQSDRLLAFARFDRCRWQSHGDVDMRHD